MALQDLICWLGPTRIINPNGITVSDVRQTILRAPRASYVSPSLSLALEGKETDHLSVMGWNSASALICFLDDVPYIEGDPSGLSLSPPEWLLAHELSRLPPPSHSNHK